MVDELVDGDRGGTTSAETQEEKEVVTIGIIRRAGAAVQFALLLGGALLASPVMAQCFEASAWAEADQLFHSDPHWVGADGAFSIDLGEDRTLWLFADTWIDPSGQRNRKNGHMIRNSVAIQTGTDPSNAAIEYFWATRADNQPEAFFARQDDRWYWPGHGVHIGERLVLFFNRLRSSAGGLGFESDGWNAVMIMNPADEPLNWQMKWLQSPANRLGIIVGFAGVVQWHEHVYALGSQDPVKSHPIFAARWKVEEFQQGNLMAPEWWAGPDLGWIADASNTARWPVFENGQTELTIHLDEVTQQFLVVHTQGFGRADLMMRSAPELTGPWSAPRELFRPPEYHEPKIMIYAAKSHPQLSGSDLVLTYATNSFDFGEHFSNPLSYYPHFVRLARCE